MPKVKSKNTPARPPTSRTRRPARKDAEPLNSAPTMVPTPPTAGPQHQEVAAPIQTEVVSTAAPIPTLISDTQDVQRLHISEIRVGIQTENFSFRSSIYNWQQAYSHMALVRWEKNIYIYL